MRSPGLWQFDIGIARRIAFTESVKLQFRSELFNIFNRAQYGLPLSDFSSSANFGEIISPLALDPSEQELRGRFSCCYECPFKDGGAAHDVYVSLQKKVLPSAIQPKVVGRSIELSASAAV
jgi:hypothetical protein